jgi:hypothetical protein
MALLRRISHLAVAEPHVKSLVFSQFPKVCGEGWGHVCACVYAQRGVGKRLKELVWVTEEACC